MPIFLSEFVEPARRRGNRKVVIAARDIHDRLDYALRRRFAFVDLKSNLQSPKLNEQLVAMGVSSEFVKSIVECISHLNSEIVSDVANLGPGFAIGHSYFCAGPVGDEGEAEWYARVIRTEIAPLLREYWFDASEKADHWVTHLLDLT